MKKYQGWQKTGRFFIATVRKRQLKFFGHIIRNEPSREKMMITEKIQGKKPRERQTSTLEQLQ
mgnify:CR=1 FL=1